MTVNTKASAKKKVSRTFFFIGITLFTLLMMVPFLWIIILSFKTNSDILSNPFTLPSYLYLDNYIRALQTIDIVNMYKNTFIIAALAIVLELIFTYLSSFAITRLRFKRRTLQKGLYNYFLFGLAIPIYVLLFPIYQVTMALGLSGNYLSLILPYIAMSVPFNTLLFTGFLKGVPPEIEEAAIIDGCGLPKICFQICCP